MHPPPQHRWLSVCLNPHTTRPHGTPTPRPSPSRILAPGLGSTPPAPSPAPPPPFYIPAGRAAAAATTLLPALVLIVLVRARKTDLESTVTMVGRLRTALIAHAAYFSLLPLMFESGLDVAGAILDAVRPGLSPGAIPAVPDNLFWQMTHLSGELFFVTTVAYLMMASLRTVPRWALLVPLAQA